MKNFETSPHSFRQQALAEIEKTALLSGLELVMINSDEEEIRFQVISGSQVGLGESEHEQYLAELLRKSRVLTAENTRIFTHPNHSINIIVTI
jgi:hypothetical protein